jgi:excisionase family DNA binding protein
METLTVAEAAAALGLSLQRVRDLAREGRFAGAAHTNPGSPHRGEWRIPAAALEPYREEERGRTGPGRRSKVVRG